MDFDQDVKQAIYRHFAESGIRPSADTLARAPGASADSVRESFTRLRAQRVLLLDTDGVSIRMAPSFSGVPTQHVVTSSGVTCFANGARPLSDEMRRIFAGLGLSDDFWDPQSDSFG